MKVSIHVHHTISLDCETREFLKSLFPGVKEIEDLTKEVKDKTEVLRDAVEENTPKE